MISKTCYTKFRSVRELNETARRIRERSKQGLSGRFNVRRFIEIELAAITGKPFELCLYDSGGSESPAYVTFQPLTLHVDREVWDLAKSGEPGANFCLAHEVGHLVLHEYGSLHFTTAELYSRFAPENERNVEWQAELFAHFLLCPKEVRSLDLTPVEVETRLSIPSVVFVSVKSSRPEADAFNMIEDIIYDENECSDCGNQKLARSNRQLKCDNCGATKVR